MLTPNRKVKETREVNMENILGIEINERAFEGMEFGNPTDEGFYVTDSDIENYDFFTEEEETYLYAS